jgi:hypothetical protein
MTFVVPPEFELARAAFADWLVRAMFDTCGAGDLLAVERELRAPAIRAFGRLVVENLFGYHVARGAQGKPAQVGSVKGKLLPPSAAGTRLGPPRPASRIRIMSMRSALAAMRGQSHVLDALVAVAAAKPQDVPPPLARRRKGAPGNRIARSVYVECVISAALPNGPSTLKEAARRVESLFPMTELETIYQALRALHSELGFPMRQRRTTLARLLAVVRPSSNDRPRLALPTVPWD